MEDFHTEIVAQVLRNSEALTMRWLCSLRATTLEMPNSIKIRTQEKFAALEQDQPGSRVDMVIRLVKDGQGEMIFIESKIDSTENPGQLQNMQARSRSRRDLIKRGSFTLLAISRCPGRHR
jgi:hypothetical protein